MEEQIDQTSVESLKQEKMELAAIAGFLTQCVPGIPVSAGLVRCRPRSACSSDSAYLLSGVVEKSGASAAGQKGFSLVFGDPRQGQTSGFGRYQIHHFAGRVAAVSALGLLGHPPAAALMELPLWLGSDCLSTVVSESVPPEPDLATPDLLRECLRVVPKLSSGRPAWPKGIAGSITHSGSVAAALVVGGDDALVGIDCETWLSQERAQKVGHRVLSASERAVIREGAGMADEQAVTLAFSAKESAFKALFPLAKFAFGFDAVRVESVVGTSVTLKIVDTRLCLREPWCSPNSARRLVAHYRSTFDCVWVALVHPLSACAPPTEPSSSSSIL